METGSHCMSGDSCVTGWVHGKSQSSSEEKNRCAYLLSQEEGFYQLGTWRETGERKVNRRRSRLHIPMGGSGSGYWSSQRGEDSEDMLVSQSTEKVY